MLTCAAAFYGAHGGTIGSISNGRFGINIISGWQRREYTQMGIWPNEYCRQRYEYRAEYVNIMRKPWATGPSDYRDDFFRMDNCRGLPRPMAEIPIITPTTISTVAAR